MTAGADPAARIIGGPVGAFLYSAAIPRSCVPQFLGVRPPPGLPPLHPPARGPADGFVDLSGRGTGLLWLNGFLLGHYDTPRGPQCTLYAPGPLWRDGENELVVLQMDRPGPGLPLRDRPDLGRTTVVTLG